MFWNLTTQVSFWFESVDKLGELQQLLEKILIYTSHCSFPPLPYILFPLFLINRVEGSKVDRVQIRLKQ